MGIRQANMGNPETKYVWLTENYTGGVNISYADDNVTDAEFRQLLNYNLDSRGALEKRRGYAYNTALSELLFGPDFGTVPDFPVFKRGRNTKIGSDKGPVLSEIILFKFIENTNNIWALLADAQHVSSIQQTMSTDDEYNLKILVWVKLSDNSNKYYINTYKITSEAVTRSGKTGSLDVDAVAEYNYMTVPSGEDATKLYFTSNEQGLIMYDKSDDTFTYTSGKSDSTTNSAYKPNSIEIRKVGFNVLGDDPLSWIDSSTLTTESIQGMYLTTPDRIPVLIVPSSFSFQINIMYTGSKSDFKIALKDMSKEENNDISADVSKNTTYSKAGLAVYDVNIKVQPSGEIEFNIDFSDTGVQISTYRDYYEIGTADPTDKPVEKLNVGKMKVIEIAQRLVYYGGNTIWFSEINRYDYIPNYNYVLFPLENTDEIVKVIYYRTSYMVLTRRRIYKMVGTFGNDDFAISVVNENVGCSAPESAYMVSNELYFMSQTGLKSLKNDVFRSDLENIKDLDEKVNPFMVNNEHAYGFTYKDQYVLANNWRGAIETIEVNYHEYRIPDTCRYYYATEAFVFDEYATDDELNLKVYPSFIVYDNGQIYAFMERQDGSKAVWRYGDDYMDFDCSFTTMFETAGVNMNYPLHKKKIKNFILKCSGGEMTQPLYVTVLADGTTVYDTWVGYAGIDSDGAVIYTVTNEPTLELPPSVSRLGYMTLGETKLGFNPIILRKLKMPVKCKNVAIQVESRTSEKLLIMSIGYTYKVGKVKE